MLGGRRLIRAARPPRKRPPGGDGRGDGGRRAGDAEELRHPLPEPRSPATCRAFWSTRPRASRTPPRPQRRSPKSAARRHGVGSRASGARRRSRRPDGGLDLPVLGAAPEFVDNQRWFNTPGDRPLTLSGLRGRVVLVDFWTYSCINCIRTLPYLKAWDAVPQGRADDRRRPHARVPVRARSRQRRSGDRAQRDPLPGRPGQRPGDLERLRQPVLAGRVLHRRPGPRPLRPLRRGRIRGEREGHPRAARRSREGRSGPARPMSTRSRPRRR